MDWVATQQDLPRLLAKGKAKGVGVTVMKTLRGARLNDMRPYEKDDATYAQAALRWVLSKPARRCRGHHHEQRRQGERVPGCLGLAQTRLRRHAVA